MREIKFRAWDDGILEDVIPIGHDSPSIIVANALIHSFKIREVKAILQYTGLQDKNGKEIYEGDITNCGVVEWCECLNWDDGGSLHPGFYFKDKYEYNERGALSYHDGFDEDIEVIGNVWENPELLKEVDNGICNNG